MAFSKAKREFFIDQETRKRANMPGVGTYSTDTKWNERGFKYHDSTASTIGDMSHINRTVLDRSCDDIDLHKRGYKQSTPLKRNALTSSMRGSKTGARKTLNMTQTKAAQYQDELRMREQKYMALYSDHEALTATVQTLKSIGKEAESALKEKDEQIKAQIEEIKTLKETIVELEAKIKDIKWNMESLEAKCKQLSDKDEKSYQQNINLEEKILGYMNRIESDEKKYNELQLIIDDLEKRLQEKAKIVEDTQLEIYSMQQKKIETEESIKTMNEETKQRFEFQLAEEAAKIQSLNQELAKIRSTVQAVNMNNERLQAEVENYSHEKQEQARVVTSYQEANAKLEAKLEAQKKETAKLVTVKTQLTARNEEATGTLDHIQAELETANNHLEELQREKQQMAEQMALKETALLTTRTEAQERLDSQVALSKTETERLNAELMAKTSELEQVNQSFALKWAESDAQKEQMQHSIDTVNANVASLEEELATMTAEGARAVEHQMEMAKKNDELVAEVETHKAAAAAAINEKSDVMDRIKTLEAELVAEKTNTTERDEAAAKYAALKTKYEDTKNAGAYYQSKSAKLTEQLSQQKSSIQKLKQKIVEQTNDTSKLDNVNQQLESERQTVEKLQAEIQSMMGEMSKLRAETNQERVAKSTNDQLRCDVESLEVRVATLTMSEDNWKARFEELNEYVTPFRQDLAKYAEEARHMNGENSKKAKELAELHCQLATNMGHQNQKQKIRYMTKIKQELQETKEQLSGKNCELKKAKRQIEALTDDINAMKGIKRFDPKKAFQKA